MKKSLLNPTPAQIKHRNRLWAFELLKNKRKARDRMYDDGGGRCCLAVAQDLCVKMGVELSDEPESALPDKNVAAFFGWSDKNPFLNTIRNGEKDRETASMLNDGIFYSTNKKQKKSGLSHKQIAECVMNTFVHPRNPKRTFEIK
jgi:hypothetical protein